VHDPTVAPPELDSLHTGMLALPAGTEGAWTALAPSGGEAVPAEWLLRAFPALPPWEGAREIVFDAVPFRLGEAANAARATGIAEEADITFRGRWRGERLGLLLGVRTFGSDRPWYSPAHRAGREPLRSPHQVAVELTYADGGIERHFPQPATAGDPVVTQGIGAYLIPLDAQRELQAISIVDRMSYGQLFLLAGSILAGQDTEEASLDAPEFPAAPDDLRWDVDAHVLRYGAGGSLLELDARANRIVRLADLALAEGTLLRVEDDAGAQLPLLDPRIAVEDARAVVRWQVQSLPVEVSLTLRFEGARELWLQPSLENMGDEAVRVAVRCPDLAHLRLPGTDTPHYLLATRDLILDAGPVDIDIPYGGHYPLPIMDVWDAPRGGIAVVVAENALTRKDFRFRCNEAGDVAMAVRYPYVDLQPREAVSLPETLLLLHEGDWRPAFARYRALARDTLGLRAGARMADIFYCRRDYPLGGTDYLYDVPARHYTPGRLIDESVRAFGGVDFIDISGWAYNEQTGRVGDYLKNDLGGLEGVRDCVDNARGVKVGLYFEGYLLDKRAALAERALPAWQMVDRAGNGRWWSGEMEFFVCPGVPQWQEAFSDMIGKVAAQTGVAAVYVDQFGICGRDKECWSDAHGHAVPSNPLREEAALLRVVRAALDTRGLDTALYIEHVPCDAMAPLADGAFHAAMTQRPARGGPTKLNLYRFAFPEFCTLEMVAHGIRPIPAEADDLHRCFFHGLGLWLKGRADSWYSAGFHEAAATFQSFYDNHGATFRATDCTPLIPTLREGLFANRFERDEELVLTLYNGLTGTVAGDLVRVNIPAGWTLIDTAGGAGFEYSRDGGAVTIRGTIPPGEAAAVCFGSEE
jgi:hypothetical protein